MKFNKNPYITRKEKIQLLQRWILVHSFIYYELNSSVVPDHIFDANSRQLYGMKVKHDEDYKKASYGYAMKDFDGSSGYGLHENLNHDHRILIERDAYRLKESYKEWERSYYGK